MTSNKRSCDGCQVCCEFAPVVPLGKPARTVCQHQCAAGCAIYPTKPNCCTVYECSWLSGDLPEWLKPDVCGVFAETVHIPLHFKNGRSEVVKMVMAVVVDRVKAAAFMERMEGREMVEACDVVVIGDDEDRLAGISDGGVVVSRTELGLLALQHLQNSYNSKEGITFKFADGEEQILKGE